MAKARPSTPNKPDAKQPTEGTALALAGEPLRESDGGTSRKPVRGLVPHRRPPGRGSEVSPTERRTIILAKLTGPTLSQEELAERFGRHRSTIRSILASPEYEQLKSELDATMAAEARGVLHSGRVKAAESWLASLEPAARRGDHRPASSLLLHTGVIEPVSQHGIGPMVQVFVGQVGRPIPKCIPIIEGQTIPSEDDDAE